MQLTFHIPSVITGAVIATLYMGTAWYVTDKNTRNDGLQSMIKAIQSEDSRLVTITFADGSQLLRVPQGGIGPQPVQPKKPQKAKEVLP
jgi:urease gamma subunit